MRKIRWEMVMEGEAEAVKVKSPADILPVVEKLKLHEMDREAVTVFMVDPNADLIAHETVSIGSLTMSIGCPREVFKAAIVNSAYGIIMMHNHPSGNVTPSPEDILLTKRMVLAGAVLGIQVIDHLIVGPNKNFVSLRASSGGNEIFNTEIV